MDITLSMSIMDGDERVVRQDIIQLNKSFYSGKLIKLLLAESGQLLKTLQQQIVKLRASQLLILVVTLRAVSLGVSSNTVIWTGVQTFLH